MTAMNLVLASLLLIFAPAETLAGKVVAVVDGDTIRVLDSRKVQHTVRLHGIDAPEGGQAYGQRSKQHLRSTWRKAWQKMGSGLGRVSFSCTSGLRFET